MRLSACVLTRNHERSVARAVRSVAGVAAEILVADTGSTDTTADVAAKAGAKVVPVAWADDFAAAANAALDAAGGDWVLWLNPDEELDAAGTAAVPVAIADPGAFAYAVAVRPEYAPDGRRPGQTARELRLYRRDPAVRYRGRVHPDFHPPLAELAAARGQAVGIVAGLIHRHAYLSPVTPDKIRWTNRLIEVELRDHPGQLRLLIELGRNLLTLNDPRGHRAMADAAALVRPAADAPEAPDPAVGSLLEYLLTVSPGQSVSTLSRADARGLADRWFRHTPPVLWARAAERYDAGDDAGAAEVLDVLLALGESGWYDAREPFDPDVLGPRAVVARAACDLRRGEWDAAKRRLAPVLNHPVYGPKAAALFGAAEQRRVPGADGFRT